MRINFLHGLDDDIREQAMQDWWKENRNFLIFAVVVLFASFGATQYYKQHKAETIQQQAIAYYKAAQDKSSDGFSKLAEEANGGYRAMALFEVAKQQVADKDLEAAAASYGQIRESDASPLLRELAAVLEAQIQLQTAPDQAEANLKKLVEAKTPYMQTAIELLAILEQNRENYAAAQSYYQDLLAQLGVNLTTRSRVEKRLSYLKGKGLIADEAGATN